jgi:proton glutamate symport protein
MWLNALQMTIVPLVVAAADHRHRRLGRGGAGRPPRRPALILFVVLLWTSIAAALLTPLLLDLFPLPAESAARCAARWPSHRQAVGEVPSFADFLRSIVPTNPIAAAANDAILPLIVFTTVFAFAMTRLPEEPREHLVGFFQAIADTMLVMINWVLWIAPIGVFALAYVVGARAGAPAFGALLHYVLIVSAVGIVIWLAAWPLAMSAPGSLGRCRFTRAIAPSQALAISTQSSLACLPAMLRAAEKLGVPVAASGVVLPMAVAVFRATGRR